MGSSPPNVSFRRDLVGTRLASWQALQERLAEIHLSTDRDQFRWNLLKSGKFSVGSMYDALVHSDMPSINNKYLWKMKVPLKIKIFTWYLRRGVLFPTKVVSCHSDFICNRKVLPFIFWFYHILLNNDVSMHNKIGRAHV